MVVTDSGPLIFLARLNLIHLPAQLYGTAWVPRAVAQECLFDVSLPGAQAISVALERRYLQQPATDKSTDTFSSERQLNRGERAVLTLAKRMSCTALLDDRLARREADRRGITKIGTAGLLLKAKRAGLVESIGPLLEQSRRMGYFLSEPLVQRMLELADE